MDRKRYDVVFAIVVAAVIGGVLVQPAGALSGAIWTTDKNGNIVNGNIYRNKCDVYLNGGPGPNAPIGAAGLPEGDYYFQVTDPSGKVLLSTDDIEFRWFHVNECGVIDAADPTHPTRDDKGEPPSDCSGAPQVVPLCDYDDTPNNGGVYKVWITRQEDYSPGDGRHGFVPPFCKTDNFKVGRKPPEQYIDVTKFKDCNANGLRDEGEVSLGGWYLWITPPDGPDWVGEEFQTPYTIVAWPGTWIIREMVKDGWIQTGLLVDREPVEPVSDTATLSLGTRDEDHTVAFGNIPTGCITACKFYDCDADGVWDGTEPGIQGVKVVLSGTDVFGPIVERPAYTGPGGCVTFDGLLPGTYTVTEIVPTNCLWVATTNTTSDPIELACEEGAQAAVGFGNIITGCADFDTKGYWHNKNGLDELDEADRSYVNVLDPYDSATSYFGAGDEPFDGMFEGGAPVAAAFSGEEAIWAAGTWQSEVSHFLTDNNGNANLNDHKEQLAQQLLAFIFNVRHRLGADAMIYVDGQWVSTAGLIADAIAAWAGSNDAAIVAMEQKLDTLNNDDAVEYILDGPGACAPVPTY